VGGGLANCGRNVAREEVQKMIRFTRNGTKVRCTVCVSIPNLDARCFFFEWETGAEYAAGLLSDKAEREMRSELESIRRKAYEQGYKDAKAKARKQTYFATGW